MKKVITQGIDCKYILLYYYTVFNGQFLRENTGNNGMETWKKCK